MQAQSSATESRSRLLQAIVAALLECLHTVSMSASTTSSGRRGRWYFGSFYSVLGRSLTELLDVVSFELIEVRANNAHTNDVLELVSSCQNRLGWGHQHAGS